MATLAPNETGDVRRLRKSLTQLPYDILLNITQHFDMQDVVALQTTCKSLYYFSTTRSVYRNIALSLLRRCRPLPLAGFQRLSDLQTPDLILAVTRAARLELDWLRRAPQPCYNSSLTGLTPHPGPAPAWYKVISAPPNEEIDWLSPITSNYTLCATRSGKVICWDVQTDSCVSQWVPPDRWELWKCRVQFETRIVFFTMARLLTRIPENRVMEFVLVKLEFPPDGDQTQTPTFSKLSKFRTTGIVMNIFLLDPTARLLSAFIWVPENNTIGLFVLPDWERDEYVYIDTNIECAQHANWSCIVYKDHIIIHTEDSTLAIQYFYPLSFLKQHMKQVTPSDQSPMISIRLPPLASLTGRFVFPGLTPRVTPSLTYRELEEQYGLPPALPSSPVDAIHLEEGKVNPFPTPNWLPESAHFVRQWWPTLPIVPRLSCTVILLADHDPVSHKTRYVLAQHYFQVPLTGRLPHMRIPPQNGSSNSSSAEDNHDGGTWHNDASSTSTSSTLIGSPSDVGGKLDEQEPGEDEEETTITMWYVSDPFDVVCTLETIEDLDEGEPVTMRPRPLVAVDFGHACWIEYYVSPPQEDTDDEPVPTRERTPRNRRLRFVSFPPVMYEEYPELEETFLGRKSKETKGEVRTLEIPPELDINQAETINIDQSHGAIIISTKDGKVFILCYE
ncbi:hypothetical protein QCA50_005364 [Cerrena zonata]|uniref:F-box domain-containing protein n=1 Tax=Cerrena zonata TaxID=2478898 RepID=A0AAW0GQX4_9APHY